MSKQLDAELGSTSSNEGVLAPELVYGDFGRLMRLFGALAFRVTRDLDLELLVKSDEEESEGDYMWYDVTELEVPPPKLRSVPN